MSAIMSDMSISTRKFVRKFPEFREKAERGETVTVESRQGVRFVFFRVSERPGPRRAKKPLPREVTARWEVERPALAAQEWEMNQ